MKVSKINVFTHKYEVFKMDNNETIAQIYNYFNNIVVGLKGLRKIIGKAKLNTKLLSSLPKE